VEEDLYDKDGEKVETRKKTSKLPQALQDVVKDPEKRKKLVVYINPPYAEAGNRRTVSGTGENKPRTATDNRTCRKYRKEIGRAGNELFAQFLYRIYREMPGSIIANFSKLKNLQGSNFAVFREKFTPKLEKLFLVPANTFDNVKGTFPIGFFVWNTGTEELFTAIVADVYKENGQFLQHKNILDLGGHKSINQWLETHKTDNPPNIGFLVPGRSDFQHVNWVHLVSTNKNKPDKRGAWVNETNLIPICVYLAVHHCIKATWINDRDQFLWPGDSWEQDIAFHNDCLVFTLFHSQNRISARDGANHWIPFTEDEVGAKERFAGTFMSDFIAGKIKKTNGNGDLFNPMKVENGTKCRFSAEALAVFDAGRELWKHYHAQKGINANAGLYDIREHFQGRNEKGNMNAKSPDEKYTELIGALREKLSVLADKIAAKVYEHGFLT